MQKGNIVDRSKKVKLMGIHMGWNGCEGLFGEVELGWWVERCEILTWERGVVSWWLLRAGSLDPVGECWALLWVCWLTSVGTLTFLHLGSCQLGQWGLAQLCFSRSDQRMMQHEAQGLFEQRTQETCFSNLGSTCFPCSYSLRERDVASLWVNGAFQEQL